MTAITLQKSLKKNIYNALINMKLPSQEGEEKRIEVFEQHLPRTVKSSSRNPEQTNYPCVIVYLDEGENGQVKLLFIVTTHDISSNNQGYQDNLSIVEKIMQYLLKNPMIDEKFQLQGEPKWFYNDEDNYPYYFSWIETIFEIPRIQREDTEAMI
ncbi:MAG: hypothetical protein ABS938_00195 [Psychrobacillus psychrodurans]